MPFCQQTSHSDPSGVESARHDLDPVAIRIQDEGDMPHLAIGRLLLEVDPEVLEAFASGLDVIHCDGDVAEAAAGIAVAGGVTSEVGVGFGAMVVCQLEYTCGSMVSIYVQGRDGDSTHPRG